MQLRYPAFLCTLLLIGCGGATETAELDSGADSSASDTPAQTDVTNESNDLVPEESLEASAGSDSEEDSALVNAEDEELPLDDPGGAQNPHFFNGYVVAEYSYTNLLNGKTEFTTGYYDASSNTLSYAIDLQPSNLNYTKVEQLDDSGRVKQVEQFNEVGALVYTLNYYYNALGLPWLQRMVLTKGGDYRFRYYWNYQEIQQIDRTDVNSGELTYYNYNWSGATFENMYRYAVPVDPSGTIFYDYERDDLGRVVSRTSQYLNSGVIIGTWNYTYDGDGNLEQIEKYTSNGTLAEIHNISYQFVNQPIYNRELFYLKTFP